MMKFKLGLAAGAAALLAFGVAACGPTTTVSEEPAATEEAAGATEEAPADPALTEEAPADAAATEEAPAEEAPAH